MTKFVEKESFKHRFAKELLHKWLYDIDANNDGCLLVPFKWRSNYGVFMELKIYETSDIYYFENSGGRIEKINRRILNQIKKNPDIVFKNNYDRGKILFVPDITIFHKGQIKILIEVIHTNNISSNKFNIIRNFFNNEEVELYVVSAEEILRNTKIPSKIDALRIL